MQAVYVINLKRRPDRKQRMQAQLDAMKLNCPIIFTEAVDGNIIDEQYMEKCGASLGTWKLKYADSNEEVDWGALPPWEVTPQILISMQYLMCLLSACSTIGLMVASKL